jgi:hypothetical protein
LARVPLPAGPSQAVDQPSAANTGSTAGRSHSGPLAKMVSWPAWARPWLPETGASKKLTWYRGGSVDEPLRPLNPDGGQLDPDETRGMSSLPSGPRSAWVGGGAVGQHGDQDPGTPDGIGRAGRHGRAPFDEDGSLAGGAVPGPHGETARARLAAMGAPIRPVPWKAPTWVPGRSWRPAGTDVTGWVMVMVTPPAVGSLGFLQVQASGARG